MTRHKQEAKLARRVDRTTASQTTGI